MLASEPEARVFYGNAYTEFWNWRNSYIIQFKTFQQEVET